MKNKCLAVLVLLLISTSCVYKDLAKTLRSPYANGEKIGAQNIRFQDLELMKRGESCAYNLLYSFPAGGANNIIEAAKDGQVNQVKFVGEEGFITFPFSKTCTVVFGE